MSGPKFRIGFELEGAIRNSAADDFDAGLMSIDSKIDRGTDGSVEGDFKLKKAVDDGWSYRTHEDGFGGEIRTPPLFLKEGIALFNQILDYLAQQSKKGNFLTNSTCGLHVNLSEASMILHHKRFTKFYAHLVTIFPEYKVLRLFRRTSNDYCQPLFARGAKKKVDEIYERVITHGNLGDGKYVSVGIHSHESAALCPPSGRRIEFRCLGNTNYHLKRDELNEALDLILDSATEAYHKVAKPDPVEDLAESMASESRRSGYRLAQAVGL